MNLLWNKKCTSERRNSEDNDVNWSKCCIDTTSFTFEDLSLCLVRIDGLTWNKIFPRLICFNTLRKLKYLWIRIKLANTRNGLWETISFHKFISQKWKMILLHAADAFHERSFWKNNWRIKMYITLLTIPRYIDTLTRHKRIVKLNSHSRQTRLLYWISQTIHKNNNNKLPNELSPYHHGSLLKPTLSHHQIQFKKKKRKQYICAKGNNTGKI